MIGALISTLAIRTIPQPQPQSERVRPLIFLHLGFIPTPHPRFVPLDRIDAQPLDSCFGANEKQVEGTYFAGNVGFGEGVVPQVGDEEGEGEGAVIFLEEEEGGEEVERDGGGVGVDVVVEGGSRRGGMKMAV